MQSHERIDVHRWREFGEALSGTFRFIRENISGLLKGLIFIAGPILLVAGMTMGFLFQDYFSMTVETNTGPFRDDEFWETTILTMGLQYLFLFIGYAMVSMVVFQAIHLYANNEDRKFTFPELWNGFRRDFFRLMLLKLIMLPAIVASLLCFYLPGIAVFTLFGVAEMVSIEQRVGPFKAIGESFNLMGKYFWITIGLVVITFLIQGLAAAIFQIPVSILQNLDGLTSLEELEGGVWNTIMRILTGFGQIANYLFYAIPSVMLGLMYYAAHEDVHGTRLKQRIRKIGREKPDMDIYHEDEQY